MKNSSCGRRQAATSSQLTGVDTVGLCRAALGVPGGSAVASNRTPAMSQLSGKRLPNCVWMSMDVNDPSVVDGGGTSGNEKIDPLSRVSLLFTS